MFSPDRFQYPGGEQHSPAKDQGAEAVSDEETKETGLTKKELLARYEGPSRDNLANYILESRSRTRREHAASIELANTQFRLKKAAYENPASYEESAQKASSLDTGIRNLEEDLSEIIREQSFTSSMLSRRGLIDKVRFSFLDDPQKRRLEELERDRERIQEEMRVKAAERQVLQDHAQQKIAELEREHKELVASLEEGFKGKVSAEREVFLEKSRELNQQTRGMAESVSAELERGERDIARLAEKENAIVVHAVRLDGWSDNASSDNNKEVDTLTTTLKERVQKLTEKGPDLSASILSAGDQSPQEMFYPFGFIVDGKLIAAHNEDFRTITHGDARVTKLGERTLQTDTIEQFGKIVHSENANQDSKITSPHNESIVHKPIIKAIILDRDKLVGEPGESKGGYGDSVTETYPIGEEQRILSELQGKQYNVAKNGDTFSVTRKRTGYEKAIETAQKDYPELPVYVRTPQGIHAVDGRKVTAAEIYETAPSRAA